MIELEQQGEWAYLRTTDAFGGLDVLHARFVTHHYVSHSHPYYAIGAIQLGHQQFRYRGSRLRTPPGACFVVHPDEAHTGEAVHASGFTYAVFYPTVEIMRLATEALGWHGAGLPFIQQAVIDDDFLTSDLHQLLHDLRQPIGKLEAESRSLAWMTHLLCRYAKQTSTVPIRNEARAVQVARELLEANPASNIGLLELAGQVKLSPHHFARVFKRSTGLAPHAYLENIRIHKAKTLLRAGVAIAETAFLTGFAHQSHFNNRFRLHVGISPGRYAQSKITQDRYTKHR